MDEVGRSTMEKVSEIRHEREQAVVIKKLDPASQQQLEFLYLQLAGFGFIIKQAFQADLISIKDDCIAVTAYLLRISRRFFQDIQNFSSGTGVLKVAFQIVGQAGMFRICLYTGQVGLVTVKSDEWCHGHFFVYMG